MTTEIANKTRDATDSAILGDEQKGARKKLQKHADDLRLVGDVPKTGTTGDAGNPTDLQLVAKADRKDADKPTERRSDGATVTRDGNGYIRSVDEGEGKGKRKLEYDYVTEDGKVKLGKNGEPLVSQVKVTIDGKTQVFSAEDLLKSGKNSLGQFSADGVTIDADGKVKLLGKEGGSALLGFAAKPDGTIVARMDQITERNGSTHVFEYGKSSDPTFVTKSTDTVHTADGQTLVWTNTRINDTDRWVRTEPNGEKNFINDVKFNERGQMVYRGDNLLDNVMDVVFGPNWLTGGDLEDAKASFMALANGRLFKNNPGLLENYVQGFIDRCHDQAKVGVKSPTDDQLASALRWLGSALENPSKVMSEGNLVDATEKCLLSFFNPQKYNNQGQIGSCYLNTLLFLGEMGSPDKVAKAFATIVSTGNYRGLKFDNTDLSPLAGQDRFNHIMTSLFGKIFGFAHMTPNFRGTTTSEAQKVFETVFGSKFPVFALGQRISKAALDAAIAKYGAVAVITMGGGHAQAISKDSQGRYRIENWWNGAYEGPISAARLGLS